MQDKYTGDVGDFGKYVLLYELCKLSDSSFRLGINWYLVNKPERFSNDGRHTHYLDPQNRFAMKFSDCNPNIYRWLRYIVQNRKRSVVTIEGSGILPKDTLYFSAPIPYGDKHFSNRINRRNEWFNDSLKILGSANAVFLDPDNGIQTSTLKKTQSRSIKYALFDEIKECFDRFKFVIIYHHRDRSPYEKYKKRFTQLKSMIGSDTHMRILRFKRVSVRDYVFLLSKDKKSYIETLFSKMIYHPYDFLFKEIHM